MELLAGQWEQENTRRTRRAEHLPYRQIPEHNKAKKELAASIITNNSVKIFWTFSMGDKLKINTPFHKQPYCTLILLKPLLQGISLDTEKACEKQRGQTKGSKWTLRQAAQGHLHKDYYRHCHHVIGTITAWWFKLILFILFVRR